jgi:hypothetical protein
MAGNDNTLEGVTALIAEKLKIKAEDPIFRLKLTLKKGVRKLNPFSLLMQGKATKEQTTAHIVNASSTGSYMIYRGQDPDRSVPFASEAKTIRNGVHVPNLTKNPFHISHNPGNISNY